jgi:hemerythrin
MPGFGWERHYSLGIEAIDAQHRTIMDKFNVLYQAILGGEGQEKIALLIDDLIEYAQVHFRDEEELFTRHGYPKAEGQKAAHSSFKAKADAFRDSYLKDPRINPLEVVEFLKDWIENHVLTLDMEYKEFMVRLELMRKIQGKK